jgi:hypothetical protein
LTVTATISIMNAGVAVQQAVDANAEMASAPTVQVLPDLSIAANTTGQLDFRSVLERLDGFMKVADLAAEVC